MMSEVRDANRVFVAHVEQKHREDTTTRCRRGAHRSLVP